MNLLSIPVTQTFSLKSDPDGEASVTVRQATEGENILRNEMFAKTRRIVNDEFAGEITFEQDYNVRKLRRREAFLVLAEITGITLDGAELFRSADGPDGRRIKSAMTEDEFNTAWDRLPAPVVEEICRYVLDVNISWDPEKN